jgi:hypothetical protein
MAAALARAIVLAAPERLFMVAVLLLLLLLLAAMGENHHVAAYIRVAPSLSQNYGRAVPSTSTRTTTTIATPPSTAAAAAPWRRGGDGWGCARRATVYAPPWEGDAGVAERDDDDDHDDNNNNNNNNEPFDTSSPFEAGHSAALASLISADLSSSTAMLARLAVAFSPPSRTLDIRDIEHVQVLTVDNHHLDIQAVVCESDGCVTLQVPVEFPVPCTVGGADEVEQETEVHCVLDNLHRLDEQAQEAIRKLEWNEIHHEDVAAEARMHQELLRASTGEDSLQLPEWWVHPPSASDMRRECDSLRKLLNDDEFRTAVSAMATRAMDAAAASDIRDFDEDEAASDSSSDYGDYHVTQAVVSALGPRGLVLRAAVSPLEILGRPSHRSARGHVVLEIPIQFSSTAAPPAAAHSAEELQAAVLALVEAAEAYVG